MPCSTCVYNPFHQIIRNGGENVCPDAFTAVSAYCGYNQDNHKDKIIKDYTFCVSECENENCFRHKVKIPKGMPVSMAELKGTPECELARAEYGRWEEREHLDECQSTRCSACGMSDLINRQDAINLLKKWSDGYDYIETETESAINEFQHLPSAQPEPVRRGRWINIRGWVHCSVCHNEPPNESNIESDFCPNCGAKMEEQE